MERLEENSKHVLNDTLRKKWLTVIQRMTTRTAALQDGSLPLSQLAEHLYCCPVQTVLDEPNLLLKAGIKTIVSCTPVVLNLDSVDVVSVPHLNSENFLTSNFTFVKDQLERVRTRKERAVIICTSGVNKAALLCAAYLMWWRKSTLISTLQLIVDRLGPVLSVESYQRDLLEFANELGQLDHPNTWPHLPEDDPGVQAELVSGWTNAPLELFNDDADYSNCSNDMCSPQEHAETRFRDALQRHQEITKPGIVNIGSECASDGGTDLL